MSTVSVDKIIVQKSNVGDFFVVEITYLERGSSMAGRHATLESCITLSDQMVESEAFAEINRP